MSVLGLLAGGSGECSLPCLCGDDDDGPVVWRKMSNDVYYIHFVRYKSHM